jgi:hypothetical protein
VQDVTTPMHSLVKSVFAHFIDKNDGIQLVEVIR